VVVSVAPDATSPRSGSLIDGLPEGSLLVAAMVLAFAAFAPLPVAFGLLLVLAARALGIAPALLVAATLAAGSGLLASEGAGPALATYARSGTLWHIRDAAEQDGVGVVLIRTAPVSLLGAGLAGGAMALWLDMGRPFWARRRRRMLWRRVARWLRELRGRTCGPLLGVDERGEPVRLSAAELGQHALVVGATGSGKTTTILRLLGEVAPDGVGLLVVDLKADPSLAAELQGLAGRVGLPFDCWALDGSSHWNPLGHGDATELMNKVVALEAWSEPHYKRAAQRYLHTALSILLAAGQEPELPALVPLLDPEALTAFLYGPAASRVSAEERGRLERYLGGLDRSSQSAIQGLANRLALLAETRAGERLRAEPGGIDLRRTFSGPRLTLFSLDSQKYGETAAQLATLVAQDVRTVASMRLAEGWPEPPGYVVFDEFSAMHSDHLLHLFARGRGAGIGVLLATQELADLSRVDPGFADQVLGNTNVKLVHRQDVPESAERLAGVAGTRSVYEETFQTDRTPFRSLAGRPLGGWSGRTTGQGTIREVEQYAVHPNVLKQLPQGTAVLIRKHPRPRAERVRIHPPAWRKTSRRPASGSVLRLLRRAA
jgi:conjugal transfer pilus assembly protein TraD